MTIDDEALDPATPPAGGWKYQSLGAAHAAAIGMLGTVAETGWNSFHKYHYATAADLSRALRPVLDACGLSLTQTGVEVLVREERKDHKGKSVWFTQLRVTYTLTHESGASLQLQGLGEGVDDQDKGSYKAQTGAFKYMLRGSFCVVVGEDPEDDRTPEQREQEALAEGRRAAIRDLLSTAADPDYSPQRFAAQLKEAGGSELKLVRLFCLWVGLPKPSHMSEDKRQGILRRLQTEEGAARFQEFLADMGLSQ